MPNPPIVPSKKDSQAHPPSPFTELAPPRFKVPKIFLLLGALIIVAGALLIYFHDSLTESSVWEAMLNCDAQVKDPKDRVRPEGDKSNPQMGDLVWDRDSEGERHWIKPNGTHDGYGIVRITAQREGVAQMVGLCDTNQPMALRLFRRALNPTTKDTNASAKLVALYCANFLARSQPHPYPQTEKGCLEASDIDLMAKLLDAKNESSLDVRKTATRALSDLVVLTNPADIAAVSGDANAQIAHTKISPAMLDAAKAALPKDVSPEPKTLPDVAHDRSKELLIAVKKSTLNGNPVLLVRWSTPTLAQLWWNEHAKEGKWDAAIQRFVIP
jgi:hypothetical protein